MDKKLASSYRPPPSSSSIAAIPRLLSFSLSARARVSPRIRLEQPEEDAVERSQSVVTPARFAKGLTFDQYVAYVGTPENLKREGSQGEARRDWSGYLRKAYEVARLTDAQAAAVRWLAAQPNEIGRAHV